MERQIPEGYEWPRFENLEPVRIGDWFTDKAGKSSAVKSLLFVDGSVAIESKSNLVTYYSYGERIKRPEILAADGEPLEVGQTVYHTDTGREYQIHSINDDGKGAFVYNNSLGQDAAGLHLCPVGNLTHQRPVLDVDGVPIKKGDTVWSVNDGTEYEVGGIRDTLDVDGDPCKIIECSNDELHIYYACLPPDKLTHTKPEPPDSWGSVWMDVSNGCETPQGMERRCKALAERGER